MPEPRMIGQDFVRSKLVKELLPVVDDMAGAPSLEDGAKDIVAAIERVCTLIPVPGGPLVVERGVLRAAAEAALKAQSQLNEDEWDECGWEGIDTWDEAVELLRGAMLAGLAALFPTGLVVAEAVGEVHMECGEPVIGTAETGRHITGCRVAVLTANG